MHPFATKAVMAIAVAATVLVPLQSASARDRWDDDWRRHERHERNRDAAVLGVLGLAAGVAVGSALAQPRQPEGRVYIDPPVRDYTPPPSPRYTYQPAYGSDDDGYYPEPPRARSVPVYSPPARPVYGAEPWTRAWYDYCSQRYRSFNARTGTFTDYDGQRRFCNAG